MDNRNFKHWQGVANRYGFALSKDRKGWMLSQATCYEQRTTREAITEAIAGRLESKVDDWETQLQIAGCFKPEYIEQVKRVLSEVVPVLREAITESNA